jgi:hypothetical protein
MQVGHCIVACLMQSGVAQALDAISYLGSSLFALLSTILSIKLANNYLIMLLKPQKFKVDFVSKRPVIGCFATTRGRRVGIIDQTDLDQMKLSLP